MVGGAILENVMKSRKKKTQEPTRDYRAAPEESMVLPEPYLVKVPTPDVYTSSNESYDQQVVLNEAPLEEPVVLQEEQSFDERITLKPKHERRRRKQRKQEEPMFVEAPPAPVIAPPMVAVTSAPRRRLNLNPVTARQAVIWMEVFGKPKGLQ